MSKRRDAYRTLLRYAVPVWPLLTLIAFVTLGASVMAMIEPWPMKVLVDEVLSGKSPHLLVWVALAGFGFFALGTAMEVVLTDAWVRAGQKMSFGLAADVFASLQRKSIVFHNRTSVGDSMARVLTDSWCVNTLIDALVFKPFYAFLTGAGIVVIMMRLNPGLTGVALLTVPFMAMASIVAGRRIRHASKAKRAAGVQINKHLQQTLTGVSVTQAFAQEDAEHRRFTELAERSIRADQKASIASQMNGLWSGLVTTAGAAVVLWIGSKNVLAGTLTIGGLLVFIAYLKTLQGKFKAIAGSYVALQNVDASVERVMDALSEPDIPEKKDAKRLDRSKGHIRIEDVTFGYEEGHPVLNHVSIEAEPGETLAIAGQTGAGKSTLVSLIPRMVDPWSGRILLDGIDVRDLRLRDLRRQVAWVPQETFLFPVSVAENIGFGRPGASRAEIEDVARAANAHTFIERLPEGYDSILGERGMTLSGGERQRLAIARAMLVDAPILILDEPTSAVDAETDSLLQSAIRNLGVDRTVIVIAHRLSTIRSADRVVRLEHGRIVDEVSRGVA